MTDIPSSSPTPDASLIPVLTIRLIKSFTYRTSKNLILHNVPKKSTIRELKDLIQNEIKTRSGFKPYLNNKFDCLKVYFQAHGTKSQNLIINIEHADKFLSDENTLENSGLANETEISFFNLEEYLTFKSNPEIKW